MMDSDQGKIFIGGISWDTTEERIKDYFKAFGDVIKVVIMKDRMTGRARGFGFVVFADPAVADSVVLQKHTIDGRMVEAKKAVPRDEQHSMTRSNIGGHGPAGQNRTKKIFVGGLAPTVTENDFRNYFEQFGTITDVVVMYDHSTQRPRGFGFITYDSEDAVDIVVQKPYHELSGKVVEVKRSIPKELSTGHTRHAAGGFGLGAGRGGNFGAGYGQGFNSSAAGAYGSRMNNKHVAAPAGRGGYPSYGPTGYNAPGYGNGGGYAPAITGGSYSSTGFGSNPGYGTSPGGGYGGAPIGYGNPACYGNPANVGYGNNPAPGRNMWGNGAMPYGNTGNSTAYGNAGNGSITGYGSAGSWGSGQLGNSQPSGTSAGYASGYGSTENDYASSGGAYPTQNGAYGIGVAPYVATGGYGGAYSGAYGNSGYGESTWRTNPPEPVGAHSGGYGFGNVAADGLHE
uniref:TSA: Wollemia nobilis Ref_Wollemi_Transcript_2383_1977 transcribed RNA sequence n=1 Tax=Wollemia nobilis TaxID=56998 RepID=A0A0C9SAN2_9CONI